MLLYRDGVRLLPLYFVGFITACGNDSVQSGDDGPDAGPVDGAALFAEHCSSCHGDAGEGTTLAPQILSPVRPYATYVVRAGRDELEYLDPMTAFDRETLSDGELVAILDFLAAAAKPTTGEGLYTRFCGNCHGANAQGGRSDKDLTHEVDEGVGEVMETVREGHGGADYGDRTEYMPGWSSAELTNADVAAITAYIASLPPGPGDDDDDDDDDDDRDD
jgi:mono/diheme cytochrome c family protein